MPITILQIIPNLGAGGAEQACVDIAAALKNRGDKALVVSAGGNRVAEVRMVGGEHFVRAVDSKNPLVIINNAIWLAEFIRNHKVDIVHVRSRAPAWSAWIASRMASRPFVSTFHAAYKFSNPLKKFYNRVMTRPNRIIAISQFIADHIRDTYDIDAKKIRIVHRGINLEKFSPDHVDETHRALLRNAWAIEKNQRVILLPARLSPIKGHGFLIKAMGLLPSDLLQNVVLVIVGDDQGRAGYRHELNKLIKDNGLQNNVKLVDHCDDMPAAYSLADLVVVPSQVPEGFGRVPVEAMAMGIPVIASLLGATQETILNGNTGWLLPSNDHKLWAETICKALLLSQSQRDQMSNLAVERAHKLYDHKKMVADTLAVYDELMRQER